MDCGLDGGLWLLQDGSRNVDAAVSALLPLVDMQEHGVTILGLCLRSVIAYRVHTVQVRSTALVNVAGRLKPSSGECKMKHLHHEEKRSFRTVGFRPFLSCSCSSLLSLNLGLHGPLP